MSRIKAPAELPELVKTAFSSALQSGELHYFPTQVTTLLANSIPFQLRFSPALANKPKGPPPEPSAKKKPFDPFDNPPPALRVNAELKDHSSSSPSHFLVLNKFAVVREHFILATTDFKQQTHLLEPLDLEATLACIEAYEGADGTAEGGSGGLYAFFNSGEHSGASQPHRHIQLLPIARMKDGLEDSRQSSDPSRQWKVMVDSLNEGGSNDLPFVVFKEPIHLDMSGEELHAAYLRLYRQACRAVTQHLGGKKTPEDDTVVSATEGEALISYNMAMTKTTLALTPRLSEGPQITDDEGRVLGSLALNGTVLAGTALVKSELEWEALKGRDRKGFADLLRGIGIPNASAGTVEGHGHSGKI